MSDATAMSDLVVQSLLAGECGTQIARIEHGGDSPALRALLGKSACPFVLSELAEIKASRVGKLFAAWRESEWSEEIKFDSVNDSTRRFTYWDQATLLAPAMDATDADHTAVRASSGEFLQAIFSEQSASKWGTVRFGGAAHTFSGRLASLLDELSFLSPPTAQGASARSPTVFASAGGVSCSAHFDNFANTHVLLLGRKRAHLAPPSAAFDLLVRPGAHPSARQARCSLAAASTDSSAECSYTGPSFEVELEASEALYIPPGWLHEFATLAPSVTISLTADTAEWLDFGRWVDGRATNPSSSLPVVLPPTATPSSPSRRPSQVGDGRAEHRIHPVHGRRAALGRRRVDGAALRVVARRLRPRADRRARPRLSGWATGRRHARIDERDRRWLPAGDVAAHVWRRHAKRGRPLVAARCGAVP